MIKHLVQFEHKIDEFVGSFILTPNTPTTIAKEFLLEFIKMVGQIEDQGKAAMEAQAKESPVEEEVQPHD